MAPIVVGLWVTAAAINWPSGDHDKLAMLTGEGKLISVDIAPDATLIRSMPLLRPAARRASPGSQATDAGQSGSNRRRPLPSRAITHNPGLSTVDPLVATAVVDVTMRGAGRAE